MTRLIFPQSRLATRLATICLPNAIVWTLGLIEMILVHLTSRSLWLASQTNLTLSELELSELFRRLLPKYQLAANLSSRVAAKIVAKHDGLLGNRLATSGIVLAFDLKEDDSHDSNQGKVQPIPRAFDECQHEFLGGRSRADEVVQKEEH